MHKAALTHAQRSAPRMREQVSQSEWAARVDLAASYRLAAHHGWDELISTHFSARVPDEPDAMLLNPYGLLFSQITASSLIKVRISKGEQLSESPFPLNVAAVNIHSGILAARPDVQAVCHLHTIAGVAVSTMRDGLLPLNQRACYFDPAYHDYEGIAVNPHEQERLAADLGDKWVMFLRNHGTLVVGRSVANAFVTTYFLERVCETQVATLSMNQPLTVLPDDFVVEVRKSARHVRHWGLHEWPGLVSLLDGINPGYEQ